MLRELLASRAFQKYLIDGTVEQLLADAAPHGSPQGEQLGPPFRPSTSNAVTVIAEGVDMLVRLLELIVESFLRSCKNSSIVPQVMHSIN